ncbi:hypothetical protein BH11MYX1_BH11MYX1_01140 [soil metagenome]
MRRALLLVIVAACGSSSPDHATADAATTHDATRPDAPPDGTDGAVSAGFGDLSGMCGVIHEVDLTQPTFEMIEVSFGFAMQYVDPGDRAQLTAGGQHLAATPNAGGSSGLSEIFAYEELARCEGATFLKSETEIAYEPPTSKKTDLEVVMGTHKIGVSVTRAFKGPFGSGPLTAAASDELANRKLSDIHASTAGVQTSADRWDKQILAVLVDNAEDAATFRTSVSAIDATVKGDTILILTTTDGADDFIYTNQ